MPKQPTDPLIAQLRNLAQSSPNLKAAAQIYEIILPVLRDASFNVTPVEMSAEYAREKLGRGIFLLHGEKPRLDPGSVRDLLIQLARALEKIRPAAKPIREALERNKISFEKVLPLLLASEKENIDAFAQELKLDPGLFWTLAQNALKPAYRAWAQQLGSHLHRTAFGAVPVLPPDTDWERADCFVCGDLALLSELQGNDQERHLRCGRCGADWKYRRLKCIYCGNENPRTLGTLFEESSRTSLSAQTCDNCHGYVKMIAAFSPNPPEMLVVHDLSSLPLDFIAQKNGYTRTPAK